MRVLKRIFMGVCIFIVAGCVAIMVLALNPSVTESLASTLYGGGEETDEGQESGADGIDQDGIQDGVPGGPQQTGGAANGNGSTEGVQAGNTTYVAPENGVAAPNQISGRNGYEPIREETLKVADTEADSLKDTLNIGETGDGLDFDTDIYPYYGILQRDMKKLYRQIYANAVKGTASFAPVIDVNVGQLKNVFEAVYNDHPELFWLETGYSCKYIQSGQCIEISLQYYPIANNLENAKAVFESQAQNIVNGAKSLGSDYEKEKYVHDALISRVEYDAGVSLNQSAYSALVSGKSVCAGYARAFQYIMQQLGIPCYYCTGYSGEDHAWNIVGLSGSYYNVDATWDDTNPATYNYFNQSDQNFSTTHVRKGLSVYLPACGGGAYSGLEEGAPAAVELAEVTEPVATPKPEKPLTWQEYNNITPSEALKRAGVTDAQVLKTVEEYYANCLAKLKEAGSGDQQFTNVVTETLWNILEREYSESRHEKGYVEEALKELKMEKFAIQLQAENLGDGYYRIYHNVVTWTD